MKIIAEIGINYAYGNTVADFVGNAEKLIDVAAVAECTHVKFQKRSPELSTPESKKNEPKTVPWRDGPTTYIQYKHDIEFSMDEMKHLFDYASSKNIVPFASVWDTESAESMAPLMHIVKIPSAHLTNWELLKLCHKRYRFRILSTGMSTEEEIKRAMPIYNPHMIMHTNSTYPAPVKDLNMGYLDHLARKYPDKQIGFSNHAFGLIPMIVASGKNISWLEFHLTLDHTLWGSDQSSSVEPVGVFKLIRAIRDVEIAFSKGDEPRKLYPGEEKKRDSLRG